MIWHSDERITRSYEGLKNAGHFTFSGNSMDSLIRESIQNSIDVKIKNDEPLKVIFRKHTISKDSLPNINILNDIITRMKCYPLCNEEDKNIFKNIQSLIKMNNIRLLEVADYNTEGAKGGDYEIGEKWHSLVNTRGHSNKGDNSIGSYGIGKAALLAYSQMRTVINSTYVNSEKKWKLMGKGFLSNWEDKDGIYHEDELYLTHKIGEKGPESLSDPKLLPTEESKKVFYRDTQGTSQFIILPFDVKSWDSEFTKSILRNYWLLISNNKIEIEIYDSNELKKKITSNNLIKLFEKYFKIENYKDTIDENAALYGNPYLFYKAYNSNEPILKVLPHIGKVKLYFQNYLNEEEFIPKAATQRRISMVRNDMLIVNDRISRPGKYLGLFMCDDERGNKILRKMEPPAHDEFKPSLITKETEIKDVNGNIIDEKIAKKILSNIKNWIKKVAKEDDINRLNNEDHEINELSKIINIEDFEQEKKNENGESKDEESSLRKIKYFDEKPIKQKINPKKSQFKAQTEESEEDGNPERKNIGKKSNKRKRTKSKEYIKDGDGNNIISISDLYIRSYLFNQDKKINSYKILFKCLDKSINLKNESINSNLLIRQKADTKFTASFKIDSIKHENNSIIKFESKLDSNGNISGYELKNVKIPSSLILNVQEPYKSTFDISIKV